MGSISAMLFSPINISVHFLDLIYVSWPSVTGLPNFPFHGVLMVSLFLVLFQQSSRTSQVYCGWKGAF